MLSLLFSSDSYGMEHPKTDIQFTQFTNYIKAIIKYKVEYILQHHANADIFHDIIFRNLLMTAESKIAGFEQANISIDLVIAASSGNQGLCERFVYNGADLSKALVFAAHDHLQEVAQWCIKSGADLDKALVFAATLGLQNTAEWLIKNGANINKSLVFAAESKLQDTCERLISIGADLNEALLLAAKLGCKKDIAEWLVQNITFNTNASVQGNQHNLQTQLSVGSGNSESKIINENQQQVATSVSVLEIEKLQHGKPTVRTIQHICEICDRVFKQKCHLDEHIISHMSKKPFVCECCGVGYQRNRDLNRHVRTKHGK